MKVSKAREKLRQVIADQKEAAKDIDRTKNWYKVILATPGKYPEIAVQYATEAKKKFEGTSED